MGSITEWYEFILNGVSIDELPMPENYSNWIKLFQEYGNPAHSAQMINLKTGIPLYYIRSMQRSYAKFNEHDERSLPENVETEQAVSQYNSYPLTPLSNCENEFQVTSCENIASIRRNRSKKYGKPSYFKFGIYETVYSIHDLSENGMLCDIFTVNDVALHVNVNCKKNLLRRLKQLCEAGILSCDCSCKQNRYTINETAFREFLDSTPYHTFLNIKAEIETHQQRQAERSNFA